MSVAAVNRLGWRMARRNNLYLFAWLCATALPFGLQWMAGSMEEVRDFLDFYYGPMSLWMFFSLTYGFATVFTSYYLVSSLRRAGTLDLLRVSGVKPWHVTAGVFSQLQLILIPPMIGFTVVFWLLSRSGLSEMLQGANPGQIAGFALASLCNQALLAALPCLAIYRREGAAALLGALFVPVMNALPIVLLYVRNWHPAAYVALTLGLVALLLMLSVALLSQMWPAQRAPRRGA